VHLLDASWCTLARCPACVHAQASFQCGCLPKVRVNAAGADATLPGATGRLASSRVLHCSLAALTCAGQSSQYIAIMSPREVSESSCLLSRLEFAGGFFHDDSDQAGLMTTSKGMEIWVWLASQLLLSTSRCCDSRTPHALHQFMVMQTQVTGSGSIPGCREILYRDSRALKHVCATYGAAGCSSGQRSMLMLEHLSSEACCSVRELSGT
jgi:hypothetical protein